MVHSDDMHREVGDISTRRYRKNTKKRKKLETQNSKHFRALTLSGAPSTLMHTRPFTRVKEFVCVCEKKINGSGSTVLSCMICSFKKPCRHIFGKKICRAHTRKKRTTRKVDFTNAVSTVKKKKNVPLSVAHNICFVALVICVGCTRHCSTNRNSSPFPWRSWNAGMPHITRRTTHSSLRNVDAKGNL